MRAVRLSLMTAAAVSTAVVGFVPATAVAKRGDSNGKGRGTVLAHVDTDTFVMTTKGGKLKAIDVASLPAVGSVIKVSGKTSAPTVRVLGATTKAHIKGKVSALGTNTFTVAGRKAPAAVVLTYATPIMQPAVDDKVKVRVTIGADGALSVASLRVSDDDDESSSNSSSAAPGSSSSTDDSSSSNRDDSASDERGRGECEDDKRGRARETDADADDDDHGRGRGRGADSHDDERGRGSDD